MPLQGYARVSTTDQDTGLQVRALRAAGVSVRRIVQETRSGALERPALDRLLARLKPGDVLTVYKVDRLARSLAELLRILQRVTDAGASFRSLTEPIDTTSPAGRMLVQLLGAFAEFERAIIRERCAAGMVEARAKGVRFGRPPAFTPVQLKQVAALKARGLTHRAIAARFKVHPDTIGRALGTKQ